LFKFADLVHESVQFLQLGGRHYLPYVTVVEQRFGRVTSVWPKG